MILSPGSEDEVREGVHRAEPGMRLLPVAGGTKPALSASNREDVEFLDLSRLSGVLEYDPAELTLTALAGTPVREVQAALAEHGQHLPFDPLLADAGSTLGGAVATGAAGPGAWRNGGVRDFVIGVRFVDGTGRLIAGGGKVVKNAAGFDLPKLLVGSIGRLGVIVQLSFKVFPRPPASLTVEFAAGSLDHAIKVAISLARGPVELEALEILPGGVFLARLAGRGDTLESRSARLASIVTGAEVTRHYQGADELRLWRDAAAFAWLEPDDLLVRIGLTVRQVAQLDRALTASTSSQSRARYGIGGTVAWIPWPASIPLDELDTILRSLGLPGMVLIGPPDRPILGPATGGAFGVRVAGAIDPNSRFLEV